MSIRTITDANFISFHFYALERWHW